jgi:hypothetical protein
MQPIVHPGFVMTSRRGARNAKVPGRFPARGLPHPSVRALVLAGHRVHRAPAGTAAPHRRTGRAPARRPLPVAVTRTDPP